MPLLSVATGGFLCFIQITDCEVTLTSPMIQPASRHGSNSQGNQSLQVPSSAQQ